jgi:hypothetical protein
MNTKAEWRIVRFNKLLAGPFLTAKNAIRAGRKEAGKLGAIVILQKRYQDGGVYGSEWSDMKFIDPPRKYK